MKNEHKHCLWMKWANRLLLQHSLTIAWFCCSYRQPEETLDDYLARFAADVDATWSKLDSAGKATVKSHVLQVRYVGC